MVGLALWVLTGRRKPLIKKSNFGYGNIRLHLFEFVSGLGIL